MQKKRCLIAIEGIDGSGKSAQAVLLKMALERTNNPAVIIKAKELGQGPIIQEFVKTLSMRSDSMAFMFLYQALHRQQYERAVAALDAGKIVIADRWDTSFFVYHGLTGPLKKYPKNLLKTLNKLAFDNLRPDLCFFMDTPVRIAMQRRIARGDQITSITEEEKFYELILGEYKSIFSREPCHRIVGTRPMDEIHQEMLSVTLRHIRG